MASELVEKSKVLVEYGNKYYPIEVDSIIKNVETKIGSGDVKKAEVIKVVEHFNGMVRKLKYQQNNKSQTVDIELVQEKVLVRIMNKNQNGELITKFLKDKIGVSTKELNHIEELQQKGVCDLYYTYRSRKGLKFLMSADVTIRGYFTIKAGTVCILNNAIKGVKDTKRKHVYLPNVYENGRVCWGNGGKESKLTAESLEELGKVPELFFNSYFNNDLSNVPKWSPKQEQGFKDYLKYRAEIQGDKVIQSIVDRISKVPLHINSVYTVLGLVNLVKGDIGEVEY